MEKTTRKVTNILLKRTSFQDIFQLGYRFQIANFCKSMVSNSYIIITYTLGNLVL